MGLYRSISGLEKIMVYIMTFYVFWAFFTGFKFFWNGAIAQVFALGLAFTFFPWVVSLLFANIDSHLFPQSNFRHILAFVVPLLIIFAYIGVRFGTQETELFVAAFNGAIIIGLRDDLKLKCFDLFVKVLGIIFALSIIEFIIYVLTGVGYVTMQVYRETGQQFFDQLLFNFVNNRAAFPRFQSLCEEPGVVGTICGLLLFAIKDRKEYRLQFTVFVVAGIISFSLAFYALLAVFLIFTIRKISYILLIGVVLCALSIYLYDYLDYLMFDRYYRYGLEGIDNRVSDIFDSYFSRAWSDGNLWFGQGEFKASRGDDIGAGAKVFIWRYGIIGLIMLFLFYISYYIIKVKNLNSSKFNCALFFFVLCLSFYQRQWIYHLEYMIVILTVPVIYSPFYEKKLNVTLNKSNSEIIKKKNKI